MAEVQQIGTANSKTAGTALTLTSAGVATLVGNTLIVRVAALLSATGITATVTDSAGNSYVLDATGANGTSAAVWIFRAANAKSLPNAGTITITLSANFSAIGASAYEYGGNLVVDATNSGTGASTTPSSGSVTTTQVNELCVGAVAQNDNTATTFTQPTGWTADAETGTTGGSHTSNEVLGEGFIIPAASQTAETYNPTSSSANAWAAVIVALKPAPTYSVGAVDPTGLAPQLLPGATPYSFMLWQPFPVGKVTAGGPQSFFVTATDTLTSITDSAVRAVQNFPRTATDTLTSVTDTATRAAQALTRTATDTLTSVTDSAARAAMSMTRTATDTLTTVADSVSRAAQAFVRTATDTLTTITDSASGVKVLIRTATDTLTAVTDSATRGLQGFPRTVTDTVTTVTDTATRLAQSFPRTVTDTVTTITDSVTRIPTVVRSATDTLPSVTDAVVRAAQAVGRTASDALTLITDVAIGAAGLLGFPVKGPTRVSGGGPTKTSGTSSFNQVSGGGPTKTSGTSSSNQSSGGGPNKVQ